MDGEEQKCTNVISQSRRSGIGGEIVDILMYTGKGNLGGGRYGRIWCKRIVEGLIYIELWALLLLFKNSKQFRCLMLIYNIVNILHQMTRLRR